MFNELVIHECQLSNGNVGFAIKPYLKSRPPRRGGSEPDKTFACFDIAWNNGTVQRNGFKVRIPISPFRANDYDLVIDGDDLETARVGLRERSGQTWWAIQIVDPNDNEWLITG